MTTAFSDGELALLDEAAEAIVNRRLAVPAMMMLETTRPMNMVSASMLHLISPAWRIVFRESRIDRVAALLERRDAVPELLRRVDEREASRRAEERGARMSRTEPDGQDEPGRRGPAT